MAQSTNVSSLFTCHAGPLDGKDVVILIHGMESHAGWFSRVTSLLAQEKVQCIAFDRRGFGQSPGLRGHIPSIAQCVEELRSIRQQALDRHGQGSPHIHLVGMSWGGLLASYMAMREPNLWSSATLIAPAIFTTRMPKAKQLAKACLTPWTRVALPISPEDFSLSPTIRAEIEKDPHRVTAVSLPTLLHTVRLQTMMRGTWAKRLRHKSFQTARGLPMQVLLTNRDTLIDSKRTAAWARSLGVEVSWAQNSAHSLVLDCPEWVADQLNAFIARVSLEASSSAGPKTGARAFKPSRAS